MKASMLQRSASMQVAMLPLTSTRNTRLATPLVLARVCGSGAVGPVRQCRQSSLQEPGVQSVCPPAFRPEWAESRHLEEAVMVVMVAKPEQVREFRSPAQLRTLDFLWRS